MTVNGRCTTNKGYGMCDIVLCVLIILLLDRIVAKIEEFIEDKNGKP